MSTTNLEEIRHNVLDTVREKMSEDLVPASFRPVDENGVEALTVVMEDSAVDGYDATGEFFFLPDTSKDTQFLVSLITIADELHEETINELCIAVSGINTYMPIEGFAIDFLTKSLVFKHTYGIPLDLREEKLQERSELAIGTALQIVGEFGYLLAEVNDGIRSGESVLEIFAPIE